MVYGITAFLLIIIEVIIALYVHDNFVRPYLGDVIIVIVLYCFIRSFVYNKIKLLPLYLLLFAIALEVGQYFNFVSLIGLGNIRFFCILLGTSFSWYDIICYAVGCAICAGAEFVNIKAEKETIRYNSNR